MIVWLKTKKLAQKIRDNSVSERDYLHHLIIFGVLYTLGACRVMDSPAIYGAFDMLYDASLLISAAAFPIICHMVNKRGDNADLIARYVLLTVPIAMQSILLFIVPIAGAFIIDNMQLAAMTESDGATPIELSMRMGPWSLLTIVALCAYMAWRYAVGFSIAAGVKDKTHV